VANTDPPQLRTTATFPAWQELTQTVVIYICDDNTENVKKPPRAHSVNTTECLSN